LPSSSNNNDDDDAMTRKKRTTKAYARTHNNINVADKETVDGGDEPPMAAFGDTVRFVGAFLVGMIYYVSPLIVVVALMTSNASASDECVVSSSLAACKHLNNLCVSPDMGANEALNLGILGTASDSSDMVSAIDARIGEALAATDKGATAPCKTAAQRFLCARHLRVRNGASECRSACTSYVTKCGDGARLDWPLHYAPCDDYTQSCVCQKNIAGDSRSGKCRVQ
jgi:hypothetical protein